MSIQSVNGQAATAYEYQKKVAQEAETKAVETKASETAAAAKEKQEDSFQKTPQYKMDVDKVNQMKSDLGKNMSAFKMMVQGLFQKQSGKAKEAGVATDVLDVLMNIDQVTQEEAQAAIAENGEWGVEQTAQRILDFAMALSGGDPSKAGLLRGAVEQGFAAAEKIWGGKLPDISYQTYERVMKGFDEWENAGSVTGVEETGEA